MDESVLEAPDDGAEHGMGDIAFYAWILKQGLKAAKQWKEIRDWFRGGGKDARGILIIGAGGVGKSTLGKLLSADFDPAKESISDYDESIQVETFRLDGDMSVEVVIPPGQEQRRDATWSDLEKDIVAGRFRGVVLVNAYGYHSIGDFSYKSHQLYEGDDAAFLQAYLEFGRQEEIAVIKRLTPALKLASGPMWLLTLVTKQDLWWSERDRVERYYRESEFGRLIAEIIAEKKKEFRPEAAFACLVIGNFKTGAEEVLQANTAGYDSALQEKSFERLKDAIYSLKDWEQSR